MTKVADGVWWARLPLPFALDHVNAWLLEDDAGFAVVDTGVFDERTVACWGAIAERIGRPITRLIVTHHHPDHIGMAGWLSRQWDVPLETSRTEWLLANFHIGNETANRLSLDALLRSAGVSLENMDVSFPRYGSMVSELPAKFRALVPGTSLSIGGRPRRILGFGGHSPDMVCLLREDDGLLISADQLLPRITPVIGVRPEEPLDRPLEHYLQSLNVLHGLPDDTLVLPSHGLPFRGLRIRIGELLAHHRRRLLEAVSLIDKPRTPAAISELLFPRAVAPFDKLLALLETMAHLRHLESSGAAVCHEGTPLIFERAGIGPHAAADDIGWPD